jgi:tripartite-type tricarboxylate transporter receptor subunit TctC
MAKVKMRHVPFKGEGPAMAELAAGHVQCGFATAAIAVPPINRGKLRPLGVTTVKRAALLPDIPTIAEQGLPGFDANNWNGLLAPANTPRSIVAKLNAEIVKILHAPDIRQYLMHQGLDPAPTRPEEFSAYLRSEVNKWARVVREAGASAI